MKHPVRSRLLLLALSALALSFAFSPFPLRFLSLVALVPLFWIIDTGRPKRAFAYGLFFGSVFFRLPHLVALRPGRAGRIRHEILLDIGVTTAVRLHGSLSLRSSPSARDISASSRRPFIWAALELARGLETEAGFPWGILGSSLTPYAPLIQIASFIGVYGVSAWVVLVNLLAYLVIARRKRILCGSLLAASVLLPLAYGLVRVKPDQPWFRVGIVQPNVSPLDKGTEASRDGTWADMLRLSRDAVAAQGANCLSYPETATLIDLERATSFRDSLDSLVAQTGVPVLTGVPSFSSRGYYNATTLIEPDHLPGDTVPLDYYYKQHGTPFSEHFPFSKQVPFLRNLMTGDMGDLTLGNTWKVFTITLDGDSVPFSTPICFEGIFPDLIQRSTRQGARLLVNVTNDGWFGKTPGPYQHCELMIMRTVENGVPMIRSANNGTSLIADPYGRILARTGLFTTTDLVGEVPEPLAGTFYRRFGDVFGVGCWLLIAVLIVIRIGAALFARKPARREDRSQN